MRRIWMSIIVLLVDACSDPMLASRHIDTNLQTLPAGGTYYTLPKVLTDVTVKRSKDGKNFGLIFTDLTVPDNQHRYGLEYLPNAFAEDNVSVTTSADGFLSKIDITASDQTGVFITKLAELAKETVKLSAVMFAPDDTFAPISDEIVDLTNPEQIRVLNNHLVSLNTGIAISVLKPDSLSSLSVPLIETDSCSLSFCYRPKELYVVTARNARGEMQSRQLLSPNRAPILQTVINRAPFVKKTATVTFDNGFVTSQVVAKPSEAVGFIQVPIDVVKTIASIPGELLQLKIDTTNKEKDLIEARKNLLDSQKNLIEANQALIKAQNQAQNQSNPSGGTP